MLVFSDLDGSNGFILNGIDLNDLSGRSVSGAGDVNGDGYDDLIIGAFGADPDGISSAGESYVIFGSGAGFDASLDLADLDGSNGFTLKGIDESDQIGRSVSGAGDVNGDGYDDLIIGAQYADPDGISSAGESYVVFGSGAGFDASLDLASLDGSNGFTLNGVDATDSSGYSVSGAGDINGDGYDDLII
ncbi:MAG: integrin alpha, partial [Mangrovicoccus sp.]|nr:integrin alpha [Mangrovicoccus sp.]